MRAFHCVLGNKGGVGKSIAASALLQYAGHFGIDALGVECDPSNSTLSRYARLRVERFPLLDRYGKLDDARIDALMESLIKKPEPFVVMDNGQGVFESLTRYVYEGRALEMVEASGRECFVHALVTGGQLAESTLEGLGTVAKAFGSQARLVVWLNDHYGEVDETRYRSFVYEHEIEVAAEVKLLRWSPIFEQNMDEVLKRFLTYEEAIGPDHFFIIARQRIKNMRDHVFASLQEAVPLREAAEHDLVGSNMRFSEPAQNESEELPESASGESSSGAC